MKTTTLGTPISKKWDTDWIEAVNATESDLGHRCCGAHARDDTPCQLGASHANGRCRFHGGRPNIGAPKGNTNARIHGLYARRLQTCGEHCPNWTSCPLAGEDVLKLSEKHRPICAYEQEEHDLIDRLEKQSTPLPSRRYDTAPERDPHPFLPEMTCLRENLHLLQIMVTRAAKALNPGLTQDLSVRSDTYALDTSKPSAALQAFQILSREHRATATLYKQFIRDYGQPRKEMVVPFKVIGGEVPFTPDTNPAGGISHYLG